MIVYFFFFQVKLKDKYRKIKWPEVVRSAIETNERMWMGDFEVNENLLQNKNLVDIAREKRRQRWLYILKNTKREEVFNLRKSIILNRLEATRSVYLKGFNRDTFASLKKKKKI